MAFFILYITAGLSDDEIQIAVDQSGVTDVVPPAVPSLSQLQPTMPNISVVPVQEGIVNGYVVSVR